MTLNIAGKLIAPGIPTRKNSPTTTANGAPRPGTLNAVRSMRPNRSVVQPMSRAGETRALMATSAKLPRIAPTPCADMSTPSSVAPP